MKHLQNVRNITDEQRKLLSALMKTHPDVSFEWDEFRGVASVLQIQLSEPGKPEKPGKYEGSITEKAVVSFLRKYRPLFYSTQPVCDLRFNRWQKDDLGHTHVEYDLVLNTGGRLENIEVYGAKLVIHLHKNDSVYSVQSSCLRDMEIPESPKITEKDVAAILLRPMQAIPGFEKLMPVMKKREKNFPLQARPRLVAHFWKGRLIYAWMAYGYGFTEHHSHEKGQEQHQIVIDTGMAAIDAHTGEILYFSGSRKGAEIADTGTGLAVTPLESPQSRNLNIVFDNATPSTYRLKDKTHNREIITYDANNSEEYCAGYIIIIIIPFFIDTLAAGIVDEMLPVSEDTDGDKNWNRLPADGSDAERTAGQQPETDAHYFCQELYEWYDALAGGRDGWDNNQYDATLVPPQPVRIIVHVRDRQTGNPRRVNAFFNKQLIDEKWVSYLAFWDGDPSASSPYEYLAGSKFVVAHEYHHAITDFNYKDGAGNPGFQNSNWYSCAHEGLSDVFGGLFSGQWWSAMDVSPISQMFRNLAFPRDTSPFDSPNFDHFADRVSADPQTNRYRHGTILAHCTYLMAQGGVHQRSVRTPALIPVYDLGREIRNGKDVYTAARIWYRAMTYYFSTHGALTGMPANDETLFPGIRTACLSAAADLYGNTSEQYKTTELAFYAVGLHPSGTTYGPDITFLRWGAAWWMSRPFIGISSPDWSSVDLFINNGGTSEWNAIINVDDGSGSPTDFENLVYCRVRNVGDQQANNITITFEYAKAGTAPVAWQPMLDKNGVPAILNLASLGAGLSNFSDADQDTPPLTAQVKWWIPPLAAGETVDHFCIRATAVCANDVNPYNNTVQSNVGYIDYMDSVMDLGFIVSNPEQHDIPVELRIRHSLPARWKVGMREDIRKMRLKSKEERTLTLYVEAAAGEDRYMEPPYDGRLKGEIYGSICGPVTGTLSQVVVQDKENQLTGKISLHITHLGMLTGDFSGRLDPATGGLEGKIRGLYTDDNPCKKQECSISVGFKGCLRPHRRIDISQVINGKEVGGVTFQVQVPLPADSCFDAIPEPVTHIRKKKK